MKEHHDASWVCGLGSGVIQAGLFNPYDRALYLSVYHRRSFLLWENFRAPYQGFSQVVGIRTISGGLFYPLEDLFLNQVGRWVPEHVAPMMAGSLAGIFSSAILNPLQTIKYRTWGKEEPRVLVAEARHMWRHGGIAPFLNGMWSRLGRDAMFGAVYTSLRYRWRNHVPDWMANSAAAGVATVASGPLNYAQNMQYASSSRCRQHSTMHILKDLIVETITQPTLITKARFAMARLRIGWGTTRVAVGVAFGNWLYDRCVGVRDCL